MSTPPPSSSSSSSPADAVARAFSERQLGFETTGDGGGGVDGPPPPPPARRQPVCSVLITVIDHVMTAPSPMEPEEYRIAEAAATEEEGAVGGWFAAAPGAAAGDGGGGDGGLSPAQGPSRSPSPAGLARTKTGNGRDEDGENALQVPVLRIFGPILRLDSHHQEQQRSTRAVAEPEQSACLYIHGAFPYLLARPVVAGPDGSLHRSSHRSVSRFGSSRRTANDVEDGDDEDDTEEEYTDWDDVSSVKRILPILHESLEMNIQSSMQLFAKSDQQQQQHENSGQQQATSTNPPPRAAKQPRRIIRKLGVVVGRGFYTYCPGPPAPFLRIEYYDPSDRWRVKAALERGIDVSKSCQPDPSQYRLQTCAQQRPPAPDEERQQPDDDSLRFNCYEAHIPYTMQFFKDWNLAGLSYVHISSALFRNPLPLSTRILRKQGQSREEGRTIDEPSSVDSTFLESNTRDDWRWCVSDSFENPEASTSFDDNCDNDGAAEPIDTIVPMHQPTPPDDDDSKQGDSPFGERVESKRAAAAVGAHATTIDKRPGPWSQKKTSCELELDTTVQDILNIDDVMKELPQDKDERRGTHWRAVPSLREMWREERRRMAKLLRPQDDFLSQHPTTPPLTLDVKRDAALPGMRLAREGMERLVQVTEGLDENFRRAMKDIVTRHDEEVSGIDKAIQQRELPNDGDELRERQASDAGAMQLTPSNDEALRALEDLGTLFGGSSVAESPPPHNKNQTSSDVCHSAPMTQQGPGQQVFSSTGHSRLSPGERFFSLSQAYYQSQSEQPQKRGSKLDDFELSQRLDRGESVVDGPFQHVEDFINHETLAPYDAVDDEDDEDLGDEDEGNESQIEQMLQTMATQTVSNLRVVASDDANQRSMNQSLSPIREEEANQSPCSDGSGPQNDIDLSSSLPPPVGKKENDCTDSEANDTEAKVVKPWLHPSSINVESQKQAPIRKDITCSSLPHLYSTQVALGKMSFTSEYERIYQKLVPSGNWFPAVPSGGMVIQQAHSAPSQRNVSSWFQKETLKRSISNINTQTLPSKRPKQSVPNISNKNKCEQKNAAQVLSQHSNLTGTSVSCTNERPSQSQYHPESVSLSCSKSTQEENVEDALDGIGNQGGRLHIGGGGQLKAKTRPSQYVQAQKFQPSNESTTTYLPSPVSFMVIEVHVQCRIGRAGIGDSNEIAMTPDSDRDRVSAVIYIYGKDPGGGEALQVLERGCLFVPAEAELRALESGCNSVSALSQLSKAIQSSIPASVMGFSCPLSVECIRDERQLLLRLASVVQWRDPDMLLSWDTQSGGLGYLIERGAALGKSTTGDSNEAEASPDIDMARLMGRTPRESTYGEKSHFGKTFSTEEESKIDQPKQSKWRGSGLGQDWDDRVGAGAAAASIVGRLVFSAWKIVAEEVKHPNASYLQAVVSTVLGKRIPFHDNLKLTEWFSYNKGRERWRVLHHKLIQAAACLRLFDQLDVIGRAGEAARLSGVEFSQSFPGIRGSQYKVEGVLLRALQSLNSEERGSKKGRQRNDSTAGASTSLSDETKSQTQSPWKVRRRPPSMDGYDHEQISNGGYFFFSPSLQDTNRQEALQVQALTLEPQSGHQQDPVIVCDFTALYPSLVIAYNLCYSTVAGSLDYHTTRFEMREAGRTTGKVGPFLYPESRTATVLKHHMKSVSAERGTQGDRAYVAPTGTIYVGEAVVKGVLPQVLDEMLSTRAMLKRAAKEYKRLVPDLSPSILRQLEARQLALKYVANVTYGYTSATFSGRCAMPLLADTIVECGRRTLTNAINLANEWGSQAEGRWRGCKVLYGDTDSVFVKLPGRSVEEAFQFGEEFCKAVTASNPPPVQLKLEKVYLGSLMQTKKKYCGMKFESREQRKPTFEAKGLETIRRDQCPLTQRVLRNALTTLFKDGVDSLKSFLFRQWGLILSGNLPVSDFILTGRVRSRYRGGRVGPVQAALARRLAEADPGRVVRHKERLAYIIVATPGTTFTLRDCVLEPIELMIRWDAYTLNTAYYIEKHVNAALQRCLGLAPHKINVNSWFAACPKPRRRIHFWPLSRSGTSLMISSYFGSDTCSLCGAKCRAEGGRSRAAVCPSCRVDEITALDTAMRRLSHVHKEAQAAAQRCSRCNLCFEDATTFAETRSAGPGIVSARSDNHEGRIIGTKQRQVHGGVVSPLANCTCIDCPATYERHRLRERELEVKALCDALNAI